MYILGDIRMMCKYCDSIHIVKNGKVRGKQQYLCKECGHQFTEGSNFPKMRTKSRIISTSIDLYFEGLSVRKVQTQACMHGNQELEGKEQMLTVMAK